MATNPGEFSELEHSRIQGSSTKAVPTLAEIQRAIKELYYTFAQNKLG